jgi:hypothetical protein
MFSIRNTEAFYNEDWHYAGSCIERFNTTFVLEAEWQRNFNLRFTKEHLMTEHIWNEEQNYTVTGVLILWKVPFV